MHKKNTEEQDHLNNNMTPRRLSTPWILQRCLYPPRKVTANTCNKLYTIARAKREKERRVGEERFWHNNNTLGIDV
jgi:hypothetical protein